MNELNPTNKVNTKTTAVKTFPVAFPLLEIDEDITIIPTNSSKHSKEEIIHQAFKFHSQGNIQEAVKLYQYCIREGFNDHRVFANYGLILKVLGKLEEAEISTCKAIELKPDFAEAHFHLGYILREKGDITQATKCSQRSMSLRPWSILTSYSFNHRMKSDLSNN